MPFALRETDHRAFRRRLLQVSLLGLGLRAAFLLLEPPTGPVADERMWVVWGADVLPSPEVAFSPLAFRLVFHPPLYPYFIGVLSAFLGGLTAVKVAQVLVGAMLAPALGLLGLRVFGPAAGMVAAGIAAFYPELVWFSVHFWVEGVFVVLLWWSFERLVAADAEGSWPLAAVAGLLFGLSILARETALYFLPLAALWLWWRRPQGALRAAALLVAALPGGRSLDAAELRRLRRVRAGLHGGRSQPLAGQHPVVAAGGLRPVLAPCTAASRSTASHAGRGSRRSPSASPPWFFEKLKDEMPMFWEADGQPLVHIRRGAYGPVKPLAALLASGVVLVPYLAVLAFFVLGLLALPLTRASGLLLAFLGYYNLLHVVTHGYARYRLPVLPVLFLVAAAGVVAWRSEAATRGATRENRPGAAVGLALLFSLVPSLRLLVHHRALGQPDPGDRVSEEADES